MGYARFPVDPYTRKVLYDKKPKAYAHVAKILRNPNTIKVMHNANFDVLQSEAAGFKVRGLIVDTKTMAHTATMGGEFSYGLKPLGIKFLDYPDDDEKKLRESVLKARRRAKAEGWYIATKEMGFKKPWAADYWLGDRKLCKQYAMNDAERTALLFMLFGPIINKNKDMKRTFERETKLYMGPIYMMEHTGMRIHPKKVDKLDGYYTRYMNKHRKVIDRLAGDEFNPNSPPQKIKALVDKEGLEPLRYTNPSKTHPNGQPSCDGEFLQHYASTNKLCDSILEYTNANKAINGFLAQYRRFWWNESPGIKVINPHLRQTGAITGRMSCSDPNLMNVASETTGRRRSRIAMKPREALGPRPGYLWYLPDYSQIEVWLFAFLSENEVMMKALLSGKDFHGTVAEVVWGNEKDYRKRKTYYRKCAKLIMFCTLYGGGVDKLAQLIQCELDKAQKFRDKHSVELPGIKKFIWRMSNKALRLGYVLNPMGRHCYIHPDFPYKAVNYFIQGTAADILKAALNYIFDLIMEEWYGCKILMSLHDEIIIEVPYKYHSKMLMRDIVTCMQRAGEPIGLPVPLPVGMKICRNLWYRTKEIELEKVA